MGDDGSRKALPAQGLTPHLRSRVVTTCLVLILAACFDAAKRDGIAVILLRPSPAFVASLDALGLSVVRNQWNVES